MGSRLGVIVLDGEGAELYYDHWAAQTIGIDIAADGFEATLARVRSMEPMSVDTPTKWQGAAWIEGSLLIDLTQRRVVWAEESDYLYLPRIVNRLIEVTWPDWTAVWSPEGVRGVLWLAGVDPATIFRSPVRAELSTRALEWFVPWGDCLDHSCAYSVRLDADTLVAWRGEGFLDDLAEYGPDLIRSAAVQAVAQRAKGRLWDSRPDDDRPDIGVHMDFPAKTVRWWALGDNDSHIEAFDALWPDWSVEPTGDAYELAEADFGSALRDWNEDVELVRDILTRMLTDGPRQNPVLPLASSMAEQGEEISVSASALQFKSADDFRGVAPALAELDRLGDRALPPARIVDRHGQIRVPAP